MTDKEVQMMLRRRELIASSGFRRFGEGVAKEAEECFGDETRSLDLLIDMVKQGLDLLEEGRRVEHFEK